MQGVRLMQQQFARLEAGVFLKGGGKMRDGGVAEHDRDFRHAQSFFIEQVTGMFHALALVKIENCGSEHFLEALLQIALIDGDLAAELFDGQGFADVLQQHFPGPDDLFAVGLVGQELALEAFYLFLTEHAFEAVQEQHLALCIDKNIFEAIGKTMVKKRLEKHPRPSAKAEDL